MFYLQGFLCLLLILVGQKNEVREMFNRVDKDFDIVKFIKYLYYEIKCISKCCTNKQYDKY